MGMLLQRGGSTPWLILGTSFAWVIGRDCVAAPQLKQVTLATAEPIKTKLAKITLLGKNRISGYAELPAGDFCIASKAGIARSISFNIGLQPVYSSPFCPGRMMSISAKCHERALQTLEQAKLQPLQNKHLLHSAHAWLVLARVSRQSEELHSARKPIQLKWDASAGELREWR